MIKISLLSPPARHNETCEHGGQALCRIVHLVNWHNSTTRTFSAILIPQNTPYSAKIFRRWNSAEYTFSKLRIPQSTPSPRGTINCSWSKIKQKTRKCCFRYRL